MTYPNYHPKIGLRYVVTQGGVIFEDGVMYIDDEIEILKKSDFDHKTIHIAKKIFHGEVQDV